ncbi:MAG: hypothetical protein LBB98_07745 [Treponema sp.]|nr:hypothetical protein [Treponema sp.]
MNGVWVDGSTFTMNGGEISGNTAGIGTNPFYGGGVLIQGGSTFTMMSDGEIYPAIPSPSPATTTAAAGYSSKAEVRLP